MKQLIVLLFSFIALSNHSFAQTSIIKVDSTKYISLKAFYSYEENKIDKADAFLLSSIIPGLGFYKVNREDLLFTYLGANIVLTAVALNNVTHDKFPIIVLSLITLRVFEYATLSISINDYNKGLRLEMDF